MSVGVLTEYIRDADSITNNNLDKLLTINKNTINKKLEKSKISYKEFFVELGIAWACEDEKAKEVENALYKACFDHVVKYKSTNKKTGDVVEVEQVIPASYQAQRFYLINRCPKRWANENKEVVGDKDKPIQQIAVKFVDPNNEPSKKRVAEMMKEIEEEYAKQ